MSQRTWHPHLNSSLCQGFGKQIHLQRPIKVGGEREVVHDGGEKLRLELVLPLLKLKAKDGPFYQVPNKCANGLKQTKASAQLLRLNHSNSY